MSSEKEEVSLVMHRDNLSTLKFRNWREGCLEQSAYSVAETGDKTVENKLGVVGSCSSVSL